MATENRVIDGNRVGEKSRMSEKKGVGSGNE